MHRTDHSGFAVANARRLADCTKELIEAVALLPLIESDRLHPSFQFYERLAAQDGLPSDQAEWIEQSYHGAIVESALAGELRDGRMTVWVATTGGERECDSHRLFANPQWQPHATLIGGAYTSYEYPPHELEGATLWVMRTQWRETSSRLISNWAATHSKVSPDKSRLNKRPVADARLAAWLKELGPEAAAISQVALHKRALAKFPNNRVTRENIRRITSGRKPGPKPIRP